MSDLSLIPISVKVSESRCEIFNVWMTAESEDVVAFRIDLRGAAKRAPLVFSGPYRAWLLTDDMGCDRDEFDPQQGGEPSIEFIGLERFGEDPHVMTETNRYTCTVVFIRSRNSRELYRWARDA